MVRVVFSESGAGRIVGGVGNVGMLSRHARALSHSFPLSFSQHDSTHALSFAPLGRRYVIQADLSLGTESQIRGTRQGTRMRLTQGDLRSGIS